MEKKNTDQSSLSEHQQHETLSVFCVNLLYEEINDINGVKRKCKHWVFNFIARE